LGNGIHGYKYDRATAVAWVLVNGEALTNEEDSGLDPQVFSTCLGLLKDRLQKVVTDKRGSAYFKVLLRPSASGALSQKLSLITPAVKFGLEGVAQSCGFSYSLATVVTEDRPDWDDIVASFGRAEDQQGDGFESPIGDALVQVYPVTTAISRFEYADADCVVHILKSLNKITADVNERLKTAVERYVAELNLTRKRKIAFLMTAPEPGGTFGTGRAAFGARALGKQLGFEKVTYMTWMPVERVSE
jgi:hypothetical protein